MASVSSYVQGALSLQKSAFRKCLFLLRAYCSDIIVLKHIHILPLVILLSICGDGVAQNAMPVSSFPLVDTSWLSPRYHYEPWPLDVGQSLWTFGLSLTTLPQPVVESEIPAPAIDIQMKSGIMRNVSLVTTFSTNIFSNVLQAGIQWNNKSDRFSYAGGANIGVFGGWLSVEGQFDRNWAYAVALMPVIRTGYRFDEFSLSTTFSGTLILSAQTHVGSLQAQGTTSSVNDLFVTIAVEQPFLRSSIVSTGISIAYSRTPYQSWILFNTLDQYLLIPEVFVGFQF